MQNILYVTSNFNSGGGIEKVIAVNSLEFVRRGYTVSVVSLFDSGIFYKNNKLTKLYSLNNVKNMFYKMYMLRKLCKEFDCVICMSMTKLNLLLGPTLIGLPAKVIASEHVSASYSNHMLRILKSIIYRSFDVIVSLTDHDAIFYNKFHRNVCVIRNPVTPLLTLPDYSVKENIVLSVGHLNKRKAIDQLINIWSQCDQSLVQKWRLLIVGSGPEYSALKKMVIQKNVDKSVFFVGSTTDVGCYYRKAKIFALTSSYEGFPMVLIESMQYGLSLLSYDIETGPKEIINNNTNGFLVPNRMQEYYVKKLELLLSQDSLTKGICGNNIKFARQYHVDNIVESWCALIERAH